jgi:predicted aldo/keto reductase-like oxidoreductase
MGMDRDVIDIFLLHEVRHGNDFESRRGAWEYLSEAKAKGLVRAAGLSTHHTDVAEKACLIPEMDVIFPLINYTGLGIRRGAGQGTKEEMSAAIKEASKKGIGVYGMKVLGGGNLLRDYTAALDYAFGVPGLDSAVIGFGCEEEIDDIVKYCEGRLEKNYIPDISGRRTRIVHGDCMGCGECIRRCPNNSINYNNYGFAEVDQTTCLNCGYCAPVCPSRALVFF